MLAGNRPLAVQNLHPKTVNLCPLTARAELRLWLAAIAIRFPPRNRAGGLSQPVRHPRQARSLLFFAAGSAAPHGCHRTPKSDV